MASIQETALNCKSKKMANRENAVNGAFFELFQFRSAHSFISAVCKIVCVLK